MEDIAIPDDLRHCVAFHGHLCPGLVIGYMAAKLGMHRLSTSRAGDEELIAIVENDTCAVDAIQALTGCTFGKGNLYFRDYGKMVFTFATRSNGCSVRLRLRPLDSPGSETLNEEDRRHAQISSMMNRDTAELFEERTGVLVSLPATAPSYESFPCDDCGEMVMSTRLKQREGKNVCIPCDENINQSPR